MGFDTKWWAELDDFDDLAAAMLSQLQQRGAVGVVIGVVDAAGDPHFVSTEAGIAPEPSNGLSDLLRGDALGAPPVTYAHGDGTQWVLADLVFSGRRVGAVAVHGPEAPAASDSFDDVRADLAVAVDVVAARYGRRRLRRGLAALRRISSRFSGALTTTEIAQCATGEGVAALGASSCLVYQLDHDTLELVGEGDPARSPRPRPRIPVASAAPVADCVRKGEAISVSSRVAIVARYPFMADHPTVPDQAWLALPLVVEKRPTGALFFAFRDARTFTPDELALAATIADQCAQALERARLQQALDGLREDASQRRFRAALDAMTDLVTIESAIRDAGGEIVDFRIEYMNQIEIDVAGRAANDLTGRRLLDAYPAMAGSDLFLGYVQVVETGVPLVVDELPYMDTIDGREVRGYYAVQVAKFADGIIISARNVSDAREARLQLEAAYEQLTAARQIAGLGIWSINLATGEVDFSEELYAMFGFDPAEPVPPLDEAIALFIDVGDADLVNRLVTTTPETGEPFMVEIAGRRVDGTKSAIMVAGTVAHDENGVPVRLWGTAQDVTDQRLAEQTLRETTEQLARDHASLLLLQDVISPKLPDLENLELYGVYVPAGDQTHVGGDWFDAVARRDGSVALVVGDVAGHGIAAAALMAQLRHSLRAYLADGMTAPLALEALDRLAILTGNDPYATCLAAIYDPATRTLVGASAGHLPCIVVGPEGEARLFDVNVGTPIGVRDDARYEPFRLSLDPQDTLLFFTDGLIERRGESIRQGLDRLLREVEAANRQQFSLEATCQQICTRLRPEGPTADDMCLLALRLPSSTA